MTEQATLVVGTAGHIDHGKSRLVMALTGVDPDRLPEEKARGMTIDLGFAHARFDDCELSFVDVPGHERFIRNMVAGATGVDVALLVVAADDSVMPQTREHAEVLSLLGVERCVLVLTKMDLVDDEWADAVETEARELLAGQNLDAAACVRTSAETGRGLDELRRVLAAEARSTARHRPPYTWFRLPIDRSFTVAGRGTVVTGSVTHGAVQQDAELELWPTGERVRVRDLQTHHDPRSAAAGRMRLALNLAGVAVEDVVRGRELATPGYLVPSQVMTAWIATLRMPGKIRRRALRLRLHIATRDVLAELRLPALPEHDELHGVYAQLNLAEPIVATWGQPFILRDEAATRTLGGGRVLGPWTRRWTARRPMYAEGLETLRTGTPRERLAEVIRDNGWRVVSDGVLASQAGLADAGEAARLGRSLMDKGLVVTFEAAGQRVLVHRALLDALQEDLNRRLKAHLDENPRVAGVARSTWPGWMPRACPARHRPLLAEWLVGEGRVAQSGEHIVPLGHQGALSADDQVLLEALLAEMHAGGFQPPGEGDLHCRTVKNARRVRELIDLATTRGQLIRLAEGLWLHADRWAELIRLVVAALRERQQLTVAEIRTMLDSSRKFVVPIAEKLDSTGITRRSGDFRTLGPKAPPA